MDKPATPIPALTLDYAIATPKQRLRRFVYRYVIPGSWILSAIAWLLIPTVNIETVLVSGPALFLIGVTMSILGAISRRHLCMACGIGQVAICLLLFGLVQANHWGPRDAQTPFLLIGGVYVVGSLILHLSAFTIEHQSLIQFQ